MIMSPTKQEIASYWEKKIVVEEDHLLAAIRDVSHIRAKKLLVSSIYLETCHLTAYIGRRDTFIHLNLHLQTVLSSIGQIHYFRGHVKIFVNG